MCGIAGFREFGGGRSVDSMRSVITAMTNAMYRRGPDSGGVWIHPRLGLALGHRRLAIRDLTPHGHQPMESACGRYLLTYNGEIYNAEDLRAELESREGIRFRGASDTEVLLYACAAWGVEAAVKKLIGMFAFGFWDEKEGRLTLARDRLGIKPLYWGRANGLFFFGSELKALCRHPGWEKKINRDAVAELMRCCYISAPLSIYEGVWKLLPGHLLEVDGHGRYRDTCYWDAREVMLSGISKRFAADEEELIGRLDALLRDSIKRRMVSDVPLGAFLSGGIDSSVVAALMQHQSPVPVKTFSIGFEESEYNEAPFAKAVAKHLGTEHIEEYMTIRQAREILPSLAEFYDEPFADSSQLPTCLLSMMTRKYVTVALSGDGGDELFAGYGRYFNFIEKFPGGRCPFWKQALARTFAPLLGPEQWDRLVSLVPARWRPANFGLRFRGFAARSSLTNSEVYRQIGLGHWPDPTALVIGSRETPSIFGDRSLDKEIPDIFEKMQFLDSVNYLPDDLLVKVDRASMAVSLEARVPLIDHRIYEFTWHLPPHLRVRGNEGKWILRQVLYKYVPKELVDRPKMGFGVPIDHWLRTHLREWAEDLLAPERLRREGYLDPDIVTPVWQRHLNGESYHYWLWDVLMFQSWLDAKDRLSELPGKASLNLSVEVAST